MEYTAYEKFSYSKTNQTIGNLKKSLDRRGKADWHYKAEGIAEVSRLLKKYLLPHIAIPQNQLTAVPVAPSRKRNDALYDDRLLQVLTGTFEDTAVDVVDLFTSNGKLKSSHLSDDRPTVPDIIKSLTMDDDILAGLSEYVLIFDDVLVSGAHFRACSDMIKEARPDVTIFGVFAARRIVKGDC